MQINAYCLLDMVLSINILFQNFKSYIVIKRIIF